MATHAQVTTISQLLQNGWSKAIEPGNLNPSLVPVGGPVQLVDPASANHVVMPDGSTQKGALDWDKYCTGGKADWSYRPSMY